MSIKVNCRFNELDIEGEGVDAAEFFNRSSDIIRVIYLAAVRDESYRCDGVGNRLSETIDQGADETQTSIYDNHKDLLMHNGTTGFVYDILGNLIEKGSDYSYDSTSNTTTVNPTTGDYRRCTYDLFGRMTQVRGLGPENTVVLLAEYVYDFRGMRIAKRKGAQIIRCDLDESGRNLEIEDSQGVQTTAWIGQKPLAMKDAGGTYWYISDHQGTTAMMTDQNGAVLWEDATNPFGIQAGSRGTMQSGVLFTGKVFDPDADMYYFNARWYNPETGRFASEDPARDGINWYAYVGNNPLKYTDPSGLKKKGGFWDRVKTFFRNLGNRNNSGSDDSSSSESSSSESESSSPSDSIDDSKGSKSKEPNDGIDTARDSSKPTPPNHGSNDSQKAFDKSEVGKVKDDLSSLTPPGMRQDNKLSKDQIAAQQEYEDILNKEGYDPDRRDKLAENVYKRNPNFDRDFEEARQGGVESLASFFEENFPGFEYDTNNSPLLTQITAFLQGEPLPVSLGFSGTLMGLGGSGYITEDGGFGKQKHYSPGTVYGLSAYLSFGSGIDISVGANKHFGLSIKLRKDYTGKNAIGGFSVNIGPGKGSPVNITIPLEE